MLRRSIIFPIIIMLVFSAGCARMGPDYARPDIDVQAPEKFQHAPQDAELVPDQRIGDGWWRDFNSEKLNRIVAEVLGRNWDIRQAAERILESRSKFVQTRADRFPSVGVKGSWGRQSQTVTTQVPGDLIVVGPGRLSFGPSKTVQVHSEIDAYSLSLPVSFELDLWGRLARATEAARADLLRAEETRRAVALSVTAEAVGLFFEIESLERRIQVARDSEEGFRRSLELVEARYERGLAPLLTLRQARRALAQAETTLPGLRQDHGRALQKLAVIMGRYPTTTPPEDQPIEYFKKMRPVPPGIPSDLLMRRPDIRAVEASLKALNAAVGVAAAGRLPTISLTGSFGFKSAELDRLIAPESELWNISVGILAPLFNAGKLKALHRAAESRYRQGVAEYAKTVLQALAEVEGALLTRQEQLERRERILTFLEEARATQAAAESRYRRGLSDYLSVLEAQQTRYKAEESLILVDLAILVNRVNLYRALGGGWDESPPRAGGHEGPGDPAE